MEQKVRKLEDFNAEDRIDLKLLENSTYFLNGEISEESAAACTKWLIYENLDRTKEKMLTLYINSTGGDLYQAFALIDIMQSSKHSVRTIAVGSIMSAAFLIFAAGTRGERYLAANTGIMCHQFSGSASDIKFHDLKAEMKENEFLNQKMINILQQATDLTPSKIKSKLLPASDVYMTVQEALDFGIADQLL